MANRFFNPITQYLDATGEPLSGGKLYFFETASTTPADTYTTPTLNLGSENTNPVVLDSAGRHGSIYLDPSVTYRVRLTNANDVAIWTADNVIDPAANIAAVVAVYPGDPNGNVAGTEGTPGGVGSSMVYDSANDVLYVCTQSGTSATAVWTSQTAGSAGLGSANVFTVEQSIQFTDAGASIGPMLTFDWESSTPAANDIATIIRGMGEDSAGNDQNYVRQRFRILDPTSGSEDAEWVWGVITAGTEADELGLVGSALYPITDGGLDLGKAAQRFATAHVNTIELGHATDLTLSRGAAGRLDIEGGTGTVYVAGIEIGHATDATLTRSAAGILAVEGVNLARLNATDADTMLDLLGSEVAGSIPYHGGTTWGLVAGAVAGALGITMSARSGSWSGNTEVLVRDDNGPKWVVVAFS